MQAHPGQDEVRARSKVKDKERPFWVLQLKTGPEMHKTCAGKGLCPWRRLQAASCPGRDREAKASSAGGLGRQDLPLVCFLGLIFFQVKGLKVKGKMCVTWSKGHT